MTWHDLLFMHWPVPENALRPHVPQNLIIELFDGTAWLGVIPFHMSGVRLRGIPRLFGMAFPELNVRTYVRHGGRSGVWFFSLDAASRLAVWAARRFFKLPYQLAAMSVSTQRHTYHYTSRRVSESEVLLKCAYEPHGAPFHSDPGTVEHWLTERYCLFAANHRGEIFRGDIHHQRWPLQPARVEVEANTMTSPLGISLPREVPFIHFAKRLDVVAWALERSA
jgi:uncharacterized protein YqjF (DUF2071 family)